MKITRRSFLNSVLLANTSAIAGNSHALARSRKSKTTTKEQWMAQVLKQTRRRHVPGRNPPRGGPAFASSSRLLLGRFRDPWYYLIEPIYWIPNVDQRGHFEAVKVLKGFVTDLASIPPLFWSVLRPDGEYAYAAIVHDYLYWTQAHTRLMSDEILKSSMEDFHVDKVKIQAIYGAVRAFGESAWKENARLKADGERRILKRFPPTALVNWTDWKRRSDVFSD